MSRIVIYGKGKTGQALMSLANKEGKTAVFYDDVTGFDDGGDFCKSDVVLLSPGVPPFAKGRKRAKKVGTQIVSEHEYCFCRCASKIVSVTGTNGKTTTCEMIHKILGAKSVLLGNGGTPFSSAIGNLSAEQIVVLESSSFQLADVKTFAPYVSVVTSVGCDHINYHGSEYAYKKAKTNNFIRQSKTDFALFNCDDCGSLAMASMSQATTLFYSASNKYANCYFDGECVAINIGGSTEKAEAPYLNGWYEHNVCNACGAILAAVVCGCDFSFAAKSLKDYSFLPHRLQVVGNIGSVRFVDDSKATNVHATLAAIKSVKGNVALIVGGSDKGESFDGLFKNMPNSVVGVFAVGATANKICQCATGYAFSVRVYDELRDVVRAAYSLAKKYESCTVLMSNACASFDKYYGYDQRGEHFCRCVAEIADETK